MAVYEDGDTVYAKGAGGVVWKMDVPPEGSNRREMFDAQLAKGDLVLVDEPVADETPAKPPTVHKKAPVRKRKAEDPEPEA